MLRTKKHLKYFSKSFCKDKTAVTLILMIAAVIIAIIVVANMEGKPKTPDPVDANKDGGTDVKADTKTANIEGV